MTHQQDGSETGRRTGTIVLIAIAAALAALLLWIWLGSERTEGPGATLEVPSSMAPQATNQPVPVHDPFVSSPAPLGK